MKKNKKLKTKKWKIRVCTLVLLAIMLCSAVTVFATSATVKKTVPAYGTPVKVTTGTRPKTGAYALVQITSCTMISEYYPVKVYLRNLANDTICSGTASISSKNKAYSLYYTSTIAIGDSWTMYAKSLDGFPYSNDVTFWYQY